MKSSKVVLSLIFLVLLPILLLGTQTAELSVLFTMQVDIPARFHSMDTDSTLCFYNLVTLASHQQSLSVRRIHPDGFIEPEQTIYTFPINSINPNRPYRALHNEYEGHCIRAVFWNSETLILLNISGSNIVSYLIPCSQFNENFGEIALFNDRLYFILRNLGPQHKLWVWDYLDGELYPVFSYHPDAMNVAVARLGTQRLLISQCDYGNSAINDPELFPVMLMDSEMNLSPTNLVNQLIIPTYTFDENHFFAVWLVDSSYFMWGLRCVGIISLSSDNYTFDIWSANTGMEPYHEEWQYWLPLQGNLHTCTYSYSGTSEDYSRYEIYSHDGQNSLDLYAGFPQVNHYPQEPKHISLYQDRLLLIHHSDGQHYFKLADLNSQEWIPVSSSPVNWSFPYSEWLHFINSNQYIYGYRIAYTGIVAVSCLKLDIAVSTDDPVAAPPALKAYPNPFKSSVKLEFDSIDTSPAVEIYNLRGQKVRTLPSQPDGIIWDGKDTSGNRLSSGIYFARPQNGSQKALKLLKLGD